MKLKRLAAALAAITMFASGCSFINQGQNSTESSTKQYQSLGGLDKKEYQKLAALNYKSGENVVVFVNKNNSRGGRKCITLCLRSWPAPPPTSLARLCPP